MKTQKKKAPSETILPFERHLAELEDKLKQSESDEEREDLKAAIQRERETVFPNLTAW